jgi:hypothetical protein
MLNLSNKELLKKFNEFENNLNQLKNFQHLIFYNSSNLKEHVINILLEKIYNKKRFFYKNATFSTKHI